MSVLHTESFIAFGAVASTDDTAAGGVSTLRTAMAANLRRAGYDVYMPPGVTGIGFIVRPDPVSPERNALFYSSDTSNGAAIRTRLPVVNSEAVVGGFSMFIPNEYVKATASTTIAVMRVFASAYADTAWYQPSSDAGNSSREVFRISPDLQIRYGSDAAQSQKVLVPGRLHYLEYRISPTDVRVWVDDVLVLQKQISLTPECVGFAIEYNASVGGSSIMRGAPARWSIGNWYNLVEDAIAPNVRLGPTTRIIGVRPNTDVSTMFQRPSGYASNAAVVASDLVDAPTATLQSTSVGDQDVYASTTDTATASGKLIHAVNMKVLASNLESNPHTLRPLIRSSDGTEAQTPKPREWRMFGSIHTRDLYAVARRPTDGKIFACGASASLIVNSDDAAPGTPWTLLNDDGGAVTFVDIAFRSDGWGVIVQSDGKLRTIAPGGTAVSAPITIINVPKGVCVIVLPGDRFFVGLANGSAAHPAISTNGTPDVIGNWTNKTALTLGNLGQIAYSPTLGTGNGRLILVSDRTGGLANVARSDDLGTTWQTSYNGANVAASTALWDQVAGTFVVGASNYATTMRRTTDGLTWSASGPGWTQAVPAVPAYRAYNDPDTGVSITLGNTWYLSVTSNAYDWRGLSRLTTVAGHPRGICKRANGDYLVVGDGGQVAQYTAGAVEGLMAPLGGYLPYGYATGVNPATGAAWTPAEASASQFGMRVTS